VGYVTVSVPSMTPDGPAVTSPLATSRIVAI